MSKFFFYVACLQTLFATAALAEKSRAQSLEEVYITCDWQQSSLEDVFSNIQRQTDFFFTYNYESIKKISIAHANGKVKLADLLKYISGKTGLVFQVARDIILVKSDTNYQGSTQLELDKNLTINLPTNFPASLTSESGYKVIYEIVTANIREDQIVRGTVTTTRGEPLVGATVVVKETGQGTVTNENGDFTIATPEEGGATLVVSYIGYQTVEILVNGKTQLTIQLQLASTELDEVVVVGYGTQSRSSVTGAVAKLTNENFTNFPITSIDQGIAGQLPGVQVLQNSGAPGAAPVINIRGIGTLTAGASPLVVVDGFPLAENSNLNLINPTEIASIEILKDAAAAAIYGSRGSNGVILITTKKGQEGKPQLNFSTYAGLQEVTNQVDLVDAYQRAELMALARNNTWVERDPAKNKATDPNNLRPANLQIPDFIVPYLQGQTGLVNTNWQDEIFRTAPIQNYELSVSGGSKNFNYFVSGNYFNQEGIVVSSGFERYSLRANLEANISNRVSFGVNLTPSFVLQDRISEQNHTGDGVIFTALLTHPAFPARNADGSLAISLNTIEANRYGFSPSENPLAIAELTENNAEQFRFLGGAYLNIEILKGLKFRSYLGGDLISSRENFFRPSILGVYRVPAPVAAQASTGSSTLRNWLNENTLTYANTFAAKHNFSALLGYTIQKEYFESSALAATNFPNDEVTTLNAGQVTSGNSFVEEWALLSYLGRITYDYNNKYLLTASIRRDGSSRFGENNKWGYFPSASVGWRMSKEAFFPENKLFSDVKLRASWGVTGNNQIPNFGAVALLQTSNYIINNNVVNGLAPNTAPNPNLSWERTNMVDIGLDLGLFNNTLFITADYYNATTEDLLLNVPVPAQSGFTSTLRNIGEVRNTGFELGLNLQKRLGQLELSSSFNISTNQNEVIALGPDQERILTSNHITEIGSPLGSYYGYRVLGVFQNQQELESYPRLSRSTVGSYKYADLNGDGAITDADRTILGDFFPDYTFGFSSTLRFKGLDLSFLLQGSQGFEIYNSMRAFNFNQEGWGTPSALQVNNYFIAPDDPNNGTFAKPRQAPTDKNYEQSDFLLEDGSFIRFRNITIGYTLPANLTQRWFIRNARVYLSALNPFTFTDYSGFNPEVSSRNASFNNQTITPGVDYGAYPIARSFVFGLNLGF